MNPRPEPRRENALSEAEKQVRRILNGRVRDFRLFRSDDGLVLTGQAQTYFAKQLAQQLVMESVDLRIQANRIRGLADRPELDGPPNGDSHEQRIHEDSVR